jgi:hypothetical protein
MEAKMFSLKVNEDEIRRCLKIIQVSTYPQQIELRDIAWKMFQYMGSTEKRKVRLCIKELRKRGYLIIARNGYSFAGDDPEPVIHFINGMYSRAHSLTTDADIMYHGLKQKYGDAVSAKVEQLPGQPMLPEKQLIVKCINDIKSREQVVEPPFRKSIDARGNEIALQFEADA